MDIKFRFIIAVLVTLAVSKTTYAARRVVIDTPTPCHKLEKVEGGRIYLRGPDKECPVRDSGKMGIDIEDSAEKLVIYLNGERWKEVSMPSGFESLQLMNKAAEEKRKESVFQKPDMDTAHRQTVDLKKYLESDEYREKYSKTAAEAFKRLTGSDPTNSAAHESEYGDLAKYPQGLLPDERVYLFVSSSMPLITLRNYAGAIDRYHERNMFMVLRGPVGGLKDFKKTVAFALEILKKDPSCDFAKEQCVLYRGNLIIDPLLFKKYGITGVPAVVYAQGVKLIDLEVSAGYQPNTQTGGGDWSILYGDADLEYLLKRLAENHAGSGIEKILSRRIE